MAWVIIRLAQLIGGSTVSLLFIFSVPSLASESTYSFPQCPLWALIHLIVMSQLSLTLFSANIQLDTVLDLILSAASAASAEMAALEST